MCIRFRHKEKCFLTCHRTQMLYPSLGSYGNHIMELLTEVPHTLQGSPSLTRGRLAEQHSGLEVTFFIQTAPRCLPSSPLTSPELAKTHPTLSLYPKKIKCCNSFSSLKNKQTYIQQFSKSPELAVLNLRTMQHLTPQSSNHRMRRTPEESRRPKRTSLLRQETEQ